MTRHIRRFAESPDQETAKSIEALFGSDDFKQKVEGLPPQEREDALVDSYCDGIKLNGGFSHVCKAIILHPESALTHFHLIYATRNVMGVEVFKDAEKKAMETMEKARADVQRRKRESRTGQREMFESEVLYNPAYYDKLRDRYLDKSKELVRGQIVRNKRMLYDDIWIAALSFPLVWESDLKQWINNWKNEGLRVEGLKTGKRVPKRSENHYIVWE